jgi:hypothetical protein
VSTKIATQNIYNNAFEALILKKANLQENIKEKVKKNVFMRNGRVCGV